FEDDRQQEVSEHCIVNELEIHYELLRQQFEKKSKMDRYRQELLDCVRNGGSLQDLADLTYQHLNIPVIIEDRSLQTAVFSGMSGKEYQDLEADLKSSLVSCEENERMMAPLLQNFNVSRTRRQERFA